MVYFRQCKLKGNKHSSNDLSFLLVARQHRRDFPSLTSSFTAWPMQTDNLRVACLVETLGFNHQTKQGEMRSSWTHGWATWKNLKVISVLATFRVSAEHTSCVAMEITNWGARGRSLPTLVPMETVSWMFNCLEFGDHSKRTATITMVTVEEGFKRGSEERWMTSAKPRLSISNYFLQLLCRRY